MLHLKIYLIFFFVNSEFLCVLSCVATMSLCTHYITDNKPLSLSLCPSNMWLHNAWKLLYMFIISWEGLIRPCLQGSCWVLLYLVTAGLLWRVRWGFSVWVTARKTLIIWTKNWKELINCHEPWITLLTERFRQFILNIWLDSWIDVWQSKLISWSLVFWHNWKCCSIMWFLVVAAIVLIFHSILTIFRMIILLVLLYNFFFGGVRVGVGAGHTENINNCSSIA